jgi:hypothetical protein
MHKKKEKIKKVKYLNKQIASELHDIDRTVNKTKRKVKKPKISVHIKSNTIGEKAK